VLIEVAAHGEQGAAPPLLVVTQDIIEWALHPANTLTVTQDVIEWALHPANALRVSQSCIEVAYKGRRQPEVIARYQRALPAPQRVEEKERNVMEPQQRTLDKEEILRAIATLSQSGVRISVEQIHGCEDLLTQLVEINTEFRAATDHLVRLNGSVARHEAEVAALKLRAAARDAMCRSSTCCARRSEGSRRQS
jgi:hypothetical protein